MSTALRELLASFGFDVDFGTLAKADKQVKSLESTIKGVVVQAAALFGVTAIGAFVGATIEGVARLNDLSQQLGVSTDDLQLFQYQALLTGVAGEEAAQGLKFFQRSISQASDGNVEASGTFAKLGVTIKDANGKIKDTPELLEGVADGFKNLPSDAARTELAMKLFGRSGTALIPLLKQGRAGLAQLRGEYKALGGGIKGETVQALAKADDELDRLKFTTKAMGAELVATAVPALSWLVDTVQAGVSAFREFSQHSHIVRNTMIVLGVLGAAAAIVWGILNIEFIAAIAAVVLLALVVDDLITLFEGGDSVIGRLIDSLFGVGASKQVVDDLKAAWDSLTDSFGIAYDAVAGDLVPAFKDLAKALGISFGKDTQASLGDFQQNLRAIVFVARSSALLISSIAKAIASVTSEMTAFLDAHPELRKLIEASNAAAPLLGFGQGQQARVPASTFAGSGVGVGGRGDFNQENTTHIQVTVKDGDASAIGRSARDGVRQAHDDYRSDFEDFPEGG